MDLLFGLLAIILIIGLFAIDLIFIPWVLKCILGWFGLALSFPQCLIIVLFFNIVTYGFRKKG